MKFSADPGVAQDVLMAAIEDSGFTVRRGERDTVIVFGPKGKSLKSIKFESAEWVPVHQRVYGK
jgi:hypothetical protein